LNSIIKNTFLLKRTLLDRHQVSRYKCLLQNEAISTDALNELNWQKRKGLVRFVFENNLFYKKKYRSSDFNIQDLKNPSDFEKLPILEKQEIRDYRLEMVSKGYDTTSLNLSETGGSTGAPLKTYLDPAAPLSEISWRTLNWWGVDASGSSAYLYRAVPNGIKRFWQKLLLWPTKRNWIAALEMDATKMQLFYDNLKKDKPSYLVGYVGAIDVFATFMERHNYFLDDIKAIWTTSAPLTENKRQYLQHIFKAPVYTQYGSCEFYWIAAECKKQHGMHIASDIRHVDVVTENNVPVTTDIYGDLLVTDLENLAFPLIRYRLGDRGRLLSRKCDCGLPFPLMDYVHGRISDTIYLSDKSAIPGEYWTTIFDSYTDSIKSFNVHQANDYSITINYEPFSGANCGDIIKTVKEKLSKRIGDKTSLIFAQRDIEVNDNGKTRFITSDIKP